MTKQEIQERSEQITLMLGYVNTTPTDKDFNIFENKEKPFSAIPKMIETMSMKFHSDWNWLMEVVEFIERTNRPNDREYYPYVTSVWKNCCDISDGNNGFTVIEIYSTSKIQAVFTAVSDFAKLYNKNKV